MDPFRRRFSLGFFYIYWPWLQLQGFFSSSVLQGFSSSVGRRFLISSQKYVVISVVSSLPVEYKPACHLSSYYMSLHVFLK